MDGRTVLLQRRGRAAASNRSSRYHSEKSEPFDDGWGTIDAEPEPLNTEVIIDNSKTIIATNASPDLPFDRSVNPYRGCEHGCIYCYARPSHTWLGFSAGLDFESKIVMKPDAPRMLRHTFSRKSYKPRLIALGTNTDPYQPVERRHELTRNILELMLECRHPVAIVTKSALVVRDLDLLQELAQLNLVRVWVSVTTCERMLARRMEPRASTPVKRLEAIAELASAGVETGVMFAPVIPGLNDHELENVLEMAAEAGATSADYGLVRLPHEVASLFKEWLEAHYPDRASRVMGLIRSCRNGDESDSRWGVRMRGTGVFADLIANRFSLARTRLGLDRPVGNLDTSKFRHPSVQSEQLDLFAD